jgi:hypothetical protein
MFSAVMIAPLQIGKQRIALQPAALLLLSFSA